MIRITGSIFFEISDSGNSENLIATGNYNVYDNTYTLSPLGDKPIKLTPSDLKNLLTINFNGGYIKP